MTLRANYSGILLILRDLQSALCHAASHRSLRDGERTLQSSFDVLLVAGTGRDERGGQLPGGTAGRPVGLGEDEGLLDLWQPHPAPSGFGLQTA